MITYLLQVAICWGLFLGLYHLTLRKETFFMVNRAYLLLTIVLGLAIPRMTWDTSMFMEQPTVEVAIDYLSYGFDQLNYMIAPTESTEEAIVETATPISILALIYWTGVILMLIKLVIGLVRIGLMFRKAEITYQDGQRIAYTNRDHAPFTFFNTVYLSTSRDDLNNDTAILIHEQAHISGWHTLDVLFIELVKAFFWFNPLAYGYDHALKTVHEYIADANVLQRTALQRYGRLLLRQAQPGLEIALANHFYNHQLKARFKMMSRTPSQKRMLLKYLSVLPFILVVSLVFTNQQVQAEISKVEEIDLSEFLPSSNKYDRSHLDYQLDQIDQADRESFWADYYPYDEDFRNHFQGQSLENKKVIVRIINEYGESRNSPICATLSPDEFIGIGENKNGAKSYVYPESYPYIQVLKRSNDVVQLQFGELGLITWVKDNDLIDSVIARSKYYDLITKKGGKPRVIYTNSTIIQPAIKRWPRPRQAPVYLQPIELSNIHNIEIIKGSTVLQYDEDYLIDPISGLVTDLKDSTYNGSYYIIENDIISDFIDSGRIEKDEERRISQQYYIEKIFQNKSFRDQFKVKQSLNNSNITFCPWAGLPLPISNPHEVSDFKIFNSTNEIIYSPSKIYSNWEGTLNNYDQIQSGSYPYEYKRKGKTIKGNIQISYILDDDIHLWPDENAKFTYNKTLSDKYFKYPKDALEEKAEGHIVLDLIIEKDGTVSNVTTDDEFYAYHPSLAKAAVDYMTNAYVNTGNKFEAALSNSIPVRSKFTLVIPFSLKSHYKRNNLKGPVPKGIKTTIERKGKKTYRQQIKDEKENKERKSKEKKIKNFKIKISQEGEQIMFKCVEGCIWTSLGGSHLESNSIVNSSGISVSNKIREDEIIDPDGFTFRATLRNDQLNLEGINGMSWENLSFTLPKGKTQVIDQDGMISAIGKNNSKSNPPTIFDRSKTKYLILERDNPFKLSIFNHWGNLIHSQDNYQNTWNGTSNTGGHLPEASYFYEILEVNKVKESGWIRLINNDIGVKQSNSETIYEYADQMPIFKGGQWAFYKELKKVRKVPANIPTNLDNYICVVSAVVNKEGLLTDIRCINDIGFGTKEISEKAIQEISKSNAWLPGMQNGELVNVRISLEVPFKAYEDIYVSSVIINEDGQFLYQGDIDQSIIPKNLILAKETTTAKAGKSQFQMPTLRLKDINNILPKEISTKERKIIYGISKYFRADISNSQLHISFQKIKKPTQVIITDLNGKTLYFEELSKTKRKPSFDIYKPVGHFPKGMLILSLIQGGEVGHTLLFNK